MDGKKMLCENINGRWTVNGKPFDELTFHEKLVLDEFILDIKIKMQQDVEEQENKQDE